MERSFDISTFLGIFLAIVLIGAAISFGGSAKSFLDSASVFIVIGGTLSITLACFSFGEVLSTAKLIARTSSYTKHDAEDIGIRMIEYAQIIRNKGALELQKSVEQEPLPMLNKALSMLIDGAEPAPIEVTVTQMITSRIDRHDRSVSILRKAGEIAPAMGLIGTLIGLVQMLGNLDDPSSIGPAMAVALLTTLYGAMLAYVVFLPLASKLERNSREEMIIDTLCLKGIGMIARKENPRSLETMFNSILPSKWHIDYFEAV